jgi:hypothetical protein
MQMQCMQFFCFWSIYEACRPCSTTDFYRHEADNLCSQPHELYLKYLYRWKHCLYWSVQCAAIQGFLEKGKNKHSKYTLLKTYPCFVHQELRGSNPLSNHIKCDEMFLELTQKYSCKNILPSALSSKVPNISFKHYRLRTSQTER